MRRCMSRDYTVEEGREEIPMGAFVDCPYRNEEKRMEGVVFMGLQASGKSSFYLKHFYNTHLRINMDMLKTRHREQLIFNACLESKQAAVIDNTNPTRGDRERYISGFKSNRFRVVGYYFESTLDECLARNALRQGKALIPEAGLRGTYSKLEPPQYCEGFDRLYCVTMVTGGFKVEEWKDLL